MSIDAHAVAEAAAGCRSVARLSPGSFGEVATYLPGRRIIGVRVTEDHVEVHIVARWGAPLPRVGEEVRTAVKPLARTMPVEVFIDDIEFPSNIKEAMDARDTARRPQVKGELQ